MATKVEHQAKADHNQRFLDSLDRTQFADWVATAAFYKAVHLAEMLFSHRGLTGSRGHVPRNNILKRDHPKVWRDYRPLYAFSRLARYHCIPVTDANVTYCLRRLARVEASVRAEM
jgi:hypothetical protein